VLETIETPSFIDPQPYSYLRSIYLLVTQRQALKLDILDAALFLDYRVVCATLRAP
jgi:hypothetical protein